MMKIYIVLALAAVMFRAIDDAVLLQNVMHIPSFMRKPMLLFWFQYIMSVSYIFERKQTNDAASKMEAKKINWLDNNSSDNNSSRYIFSFFSLVDPCFVIHFVGSGICLKIMISCSNEKIFGCLRANPNILLPLGVASRSS